MAPELTRIDLGNGHDAGFDLVAGRDVTHVVGWVSEFDDPYVAKLYPTGRPVVEITAPTFEDLTDELRQHGYDLHHVTEKT